MPQISRLGKQKIQADVFFAGLCIFIFGLAKKLLLADNLENYATEIFVLADSGVAISTASAWLGSLSYTLQLYFDFSAYSDMAIGLGLLFGIKLPINFFSPYKSESITEFWRRWHITLSSFLRDYLYIPLGGNRTGNRHVNLMLTMLLGGLWHGAGVNFIIWGGLHGVYLVINHAFKEVSRNFGLAMPYFLGVMITMTSVVIAWVFFRAETLDGALSLVSAMFSYNTVNDGVKITNASICLIIIGFIVTQFLPNVAQLFNYNGLKTVESWQPLQRFSIVCKGQLFSALVIVALLVGALMFMAQPTVFIYFNF
jgi:D-alanyl-lipoteichoic acid acyltransferase DltB (MBOAT superfamily)